MCHYIDKLKKSPLPLELLKSRYVSSNHIETLVIDNYLIKKKKKKLKIEINTNKS